MTTPPLEILYKKLHPDAVLPRQSYEEAIGFDLAACLVSETGRTIQMLIPPNTTRLVPTGLALLPPPGYFFAICSRSGIAAAQPPVFVANAPGVIDPDYTGEIKIILYNGGNSSVYISHGNFVAQAVLIPRVAINGFRAVTEFQPTLRGARGFGSSEEKT